MKNLTIKAKLVALGMVTVFMLLIIGGSVLYTIRELNKLSELRSTMKNLSISTLKLRKFEKDFLLRETNSDDYFKSGKSKYLESFAKEIESINSLIDESAKNDFIIDNQLIDNFQRLKSYYNNYHDSFDKIEQAYITKGYKDFGVEGELRKAIHHLEQLVVNTLLSDSYKVSVLTLRRHEKDFMIRKDLTYKAKLNKEIANLITKVESDKAMPKEVQKTILEDVQRYQTNFNKLVDIQVTIGLTENEGLFSKLRSEIHLVEPEIEKTAERVIKLSHSVENKIISFISIVIFLGITLIVLAIVTSIISIVNSLKTAENIIRVTSQGDLTMEIHIKSHDEIGNMLLNLKSMRDSLKGIISNIVIGGRNITLASAEMNSTAQQISQGASEQASSLEEVSASMEQMSANIHQNSDNSLQTDKIATKTANEILLGSKAVNETVASMRNIADKVTIINDIAFQTNILALNAAVEAARAGEVGRGFAVVAAEVRKLAERSRKAAKEIDDLTKTSVRIAEQTGNLFIDIVPSIQNTAKLVQEITASSHEQSNGANQVNNAMQQLNKVVQQNAAASEQLASSAAEMTSQAEQLQDIVAYFKV